MHYRTAPNISSKVLKIIPQEDDISSVFIECVTETLDALQIVEKWSKNDEFSQYVRALEEWDEIIGESWEGNDERYLSIVGWLREQVKFRGFKGYVRSSVERTFDAVQLFIHQHEDLLCYF